MRWLALVLAAAFLGCNDSSLDVGSTGGAGSTSVSITTASSGAGSSGAGSAAGTTGAGSTGGAGSSGTSGPPVFADPTAPLGGLAAVVAPTDVDGGAGLGSGAPELEVVIGNQLVSCDGTGAQVYPFAALVVHRFDPRGVVAGGAALLDLAGLQALGAGTLDLDAGYAYVTWTSIASNGAQETRFGNGGQLALSTVAGGEVAGALQTTVVWLDGGEPVAFDAGFDATCVQ